jgi:hypothetical protein
MMMVTFCVQFAPSGIIVHIVSVQQG